MAELPDDAIDAAARAMALVDEENGCFERVDEFDAITDPLEAEDYIQAHGYPHDDREDCEYWRRRARAAFDVIAARVRAEAVAELAADPAVTELRELWQRALEREGSLASAVADVIWKATQFGSTEAGDTFAYIVPKGCMHRLVGVAQQNGAHVPVAFRNSIEPISEEDAVAEAVADERQATYERLLDAAQGAMNEERRLRLVQFVVNNFASVGVAGSVPVATSESRLAGKCSAGGYHAWTVVGDERRCFNCDVVELLDADEPDPVATPTEPEPLCEECCDGKHQRCPEQPGCCCARRLDAASPVPAGQPVDEVVCPSCGTRIRARMSTR